MRTAPLLSILALATSAHAQPRATTHLPTHRRPPVHAPAVAPVHAAAPAPAPVAPPAVAPVAVAGSVTAESIAAGIQQFYDRSNDWDADFEQRTHTELGIDQRRHGHVTFRKPGRMRWDYTDPTGDLIVSDGTTLWTYEVAAHQAIQASLQQSQLPSALAFLTGHGSIVADFTPRQITENVPTGFYRLELTPHTPTPTVAHMYFEVDAASFQVARVTIRDALNNSTIFTFQHPRVNLDPADSVFHWTPPRGTNIVRP